MPGRARSASLVSGKRPPCSLAIAHGAGMQVAGAGVVAEAGPGLHHLLARRRRQRGHRRPARDERLEIGFDGRDGRLLQHHLGEPDAIRVGPDSDAPGPLGRRARAACGRGGRTRRGGLSVSGVMRPRRNCQALGDGSQFLVAGPNAGAGSHPNRGKQMGVDVTDAGALQVILEDQRSTSSFVCDQCLTAIGGSAG